jgi:hypothetical protein
MIPDSLHTVRTRSGTNEPTQRPNANPAPGHHLASRLLLCTFSSDSSLDFSPQSFGPVTKTSLPRLIKTTPSPQPTQNPVSTYPSTMITSAPNKCDNPSYPLP